jgi:hypothetical protein
VTLSPNQLFSYKTLFFHLSISVSDAFSYLKRRETALLLGRASASISQDTVINGADYAFKPKDVNLDKRINISPVDDKELSESVIKARLNRLTMLLQNKGTVSRLPDGGAKIQKQIAELTRELKDMKAAERINMPQVIDLEEDISRKMQKGLNL